ncbi:MAG: hypothetical protein J6K77_07040 [Ruminococcus sp.]|nr:hypothetical protein [Ruminococcus sp.]
MNPFGMMKLKPLFETFCKDHPKLLMFFGAAAQEVSVDSIIEITTISPDGRTMKTNIRVNENDAKLFSELGKAIGKKKE